MKVLKKGRPQRGWSTEQVCTSNGNRGRGCGAKLLVELDDLFQTASSSLHETDYFVTFECPSCGVWSDVKEADWPTIPAGGLPRRVPR